jgi:hypothetical protein
MAVHRVFASRLRPFMAALVRTIHGPVPVSGAVIAQMQRATPFALFICYAASHAERARRSSSDGPHKQPRLMLRGNEAEMVWCTMHFQSMQSCAHTRIHTNPAHASRN